MVCRHRGCLQLDDLLSTILHCQSKHKPILCHVTQPHYIRQDWQRKAILPAHMLSWWQFRCIWIHTICRRICHIAWTPTFCISKDIQWSNIESQQVWLVTDQTEFLPHKQLWYLMLPLDHHRDYSKDRKNSVVCRTWQRRGSIWSVWTAGTSMCTWSPLRSRLSSAL